MKNVNLKKNLKNSKKSICAHITQWSKIDKNVKNFKNEKEYHGIKPCKKLNS